MNNNPRALCCRGAFTLIELLVVVAVILILAGVSLKMMSVVTRKTGTSKTLYIIEQTRNALDSYCATMGSYPNTTTNQFKGWNRKGSDSWGFDPNVAQFEEKGLTYFIGFDTSHPRYRSWQKFVRDVDPPVINYDGPRTNLASMAGFDRIVITNDVYSIRDAWGNQLIYRPNSSCDGYMLWSAGPDGVSGNADDLGVGKNE